MLLRIRNTTTRSVYVYLYNPDDRAHTASFGQGAVDAKGSRDFDVADKTSIQIGLWEEKDTVPLKLASVEDVYGTAHPLNVVNRVGTWSIETGDWRLPSGRVILAKLSDVRGDSAIPGYDKGDYFAVESFSFGVQRDANDNARSGTTDPSIGVGNLQECILGKRLDRASAQLAQLSINGNSVGSAEIAFIEIGSGDAEGSSNCILRYKLEECFVTSWSTQADNENRPREQVSLAFGKIAFQYLATTDEIRESMGWDRASNTAWSGLP